MQSLLVLYSTLAAFGIGVTIIDLFGVFDQLGPDGAGADDDSPEGTLDPGAGDELDGSTDGADLQETSGDTDTIAPPYGDRGSWVVADQPGARPTNRGGAGQTRGRGALAVAKAISGLRSGVYFSLGAGPTGLFALLTGVSGTASLAWSAGAGIFIAILAKTLRAFIRRDLDSSIKPEEYLMDQAIISVPISPGAMGKALVSRYGRNTELYVRCKDPSRALSKGEAVRIVDIDDDCYWVEALG